MVHQSHYYIKKAIIPPTGSFWGVLKSFTTPIFNDPRNLELGARMEALRDACMQGNWPTMSHLVASQAVTQLRKGKEVSDKALIANAIVLAEAWQEILSNSLGDSHFSERQLERMLDCKPYLFPASLDRDEFIDGMKRCDSRWCPHCQLRRFQKAKTEIRNKIFTREKLKWMEEQGHRLAVLKLTIQPQTVTHRGFILTKRDQENWEILYNMARRLLPSDWGARTQGLSTWMQDMGDGTFEPDCRLKMQIGLCMYSPPKTGWHTEMYNFMAKHFSGNTRGVRCSLSFVNTRWEWLGKLFNNPTWPYHLYTCGADVMDNSYSFARCSLEDMKGVLDNQKAYTIFGALRARKNFRARRKDLGWL